MVKLLETRKTRETKLADIDSEEDRKTVAICVIDKNLGVNAREKRFVKEKRQEEESKTAIVLRLIFHRQGRRTNCCG